ncbi:addiction module antidote protein [Methylophilus sp. 14]|uniref:addiction module antidote protein n=1 Tax=Methylophilus sp. 14 TaxID=2781019 RepID=UPI00188E2366|nr:addiction module antidote protein [Methylophilus sp. 14]MBF4987118.1 putative addiction module antidote protein [Methylophilus sp. 14]
MAKINIENLAEFDSAAYLTNEVAIAAYLTEIIQANDASLLADALGTIARARGMTEVANDTDIGRTALYKALRAGSAPRFDTINKVCQALGVKLVVQPLFDHGPN